MRLTCLLPLFGLFLMPLIATASPAATEDAKKFVAAHETKMRPLDVKAGLAWWTANTTGKDEDYKLKEEVQNQIDLALSNKETFATLKKLKEAAEKGEITRTLRQSPGNTTA